MSLLADMLTKVKQPQIKREVPPNLRNIVNTSAKAFADKKRTVILSAAIIAILVGGGIVVSFINYYREISGGSIATSETTMTAHVNRQSPEEKEKSPEPAAVQNNEKATPKEKSQPDTPMVSSDTKERPGENLPGHHESMGNANDNEAGLNQEPYAEESNSSPETVISEDPITYTTPESFPQIAPPDRTLGDAFLYSAAEHEKKGEYMGALTDYGRALETDGGNVTVMNTMAYLYLQVGRIDDSIKYSHMALEINGEYVPALINLGIAHAKSGNISLSGDYFKRAVQLEPENDRAVMNLAILYEQQKDTVQASNYYRQLIQSGNAEGYFGLARIHERLGDRETALELYRTVQYSTSIDERKRIKARQRAMVLLSYRKSGKAKGITAAPSP